MNPWMIILGTVFSNMSYGIMLPTQREIVEANVPSTLKNTAHSLSDAMYGSFSGILASMNSDIDEEKQGYIQNAQKRAPLLYIEDNIFILVYNIF